LTRAIGERVNSIEFAAQKGEECAVRADVVLYTDWHKKNCDPWTPSLKLGELMTFTSSFAFVHFDNDTAQTEAFIEIKCQTFF